MDLALSELFAHRPARFLPARIGCAAVIYSLGGEQVRCRATATTSADVLCKGCGPRRVFLCPTCLDETRWRIEAGAVWCAADGASITELAVATALGA